MTLTGSIDRPELADIGNPARLTQLRFYGRGPAYIKIGNLVAYSGKALNDWIEENTVFPTAKENRE